MFWFKKKPVSENLANLNRETVDQLQKVKIRNENWLQQDYLKQKPYSFDFLNRLIRPWDWLANFVDYRTDQRKINRVRLGDLLLDVLWLVSVWALIIIASVLLGIAYGIAVLIEKIRDNKDAVK